MTFASLFSSQIQKLKTRVSSKKSRKHKHSQKYRYGPDGLRKTKYDHRIDESQIELEASLHSEKLTFLQLAEGTNTLSGSNNGKSEIETFVRNAVWQDIMCASTLSSEKLGARIDTKIQAGAVAVIQKIRRPSNDFQVSRSVKQRLFINSKLLKSIEYQLYLQFGHY